MATKTALTTVENKIPINNLATKTVLTTVIKLLLKIKYLILVVLFKKTNYDSKISSLDGKIDKIKLDAKKVSENILKKVLQVFSLLIASIAFSSEDGSQAYLIFQPIYRYFKTVTNTNYISSWKSRGLSAKSIKPKDCLKDTSRKATYKNA